MTERFGTVLQFAAHTSRLMVNEIRRHAVNKSNDNASTAIMNFLMKKPDSDTQSGWNLLQTLNILANGDSAIVADMIATQLPSALVHCLYLFFELPKPSASSSTDSDVMEQSCLTVQKLFIQLVVRLCNQSITAQELVRSDDMFILFTAMTCKCRPHNVGWRTGICEVLTSITRHGFGPNVCSYVHGNLFIFLNDYFINCYIFMLQSKRCIVWFPSGIMYSSNYKLIHVFFNANDLILKVLQKRVIGEFYCQERKGGGLIPV